MAGPDLAAAASMLLRRSARRASGSQEDSPAMPHSIPKTHDRWPAAGVSAREARPRNLLTSEEEVALARELGWATTEMTTIALSSARGLEALAQMEQRVSEGSLSIWAVIRRRGGDEGRALSESAAREQLANGRARLEELSRQGDLDSCLAARRKSATPMGRPPAAHRKRTAPCVRLEAALADLQLTQASKARLVEAAKPCLRANLRARLERAERSAYRVRARFVAANQGLVSSAARSYSNRGLSFADLSQEGNLGLMRAIDKFDPSLGYRFSTYAVWWIRHAIRRALSNQARTIRLPVHASEDRSSIREASQNLRLELGRAPSDAELARETGLSQGKLRDLMAVASAPLSLDHHSDSGGLKLSDCLGDPDAVDPCDAIAKRNAGQWLSRHIEELSPREREMVRLRFGLDGRRALTLKEVGSEFGVTRERVRQIVSGALDKLKHAAGEDPVDVVS
jgi:RNA polymerase sigma factor (sigma-70 family)